MRVMLFILLFALVGCSRQAPSNSTSPLTNSALPPSSAAPSLTNSASQMSHQIQHWIPKGTSVGAARQIMEQHQFVCTVASYDNKAAMPPGSDLHWWNVGSFTTSTGINLPVTNVTIVTCKLADSTNDVWSYTARLTAVDGEYDGRCYVSAHRVR